MKQAALLLLIQLLFYITTDATNTIITWGSPYAFGFHNDFSWGFSSQVISVVSKIHYLALLDNGELYCWGLNGWGQCMNPNPSTISSPTLVSSSAWGGRTIKQIALTDMSSHALMQDGTVFSWGGNVYGNLGDGTKTQKSYSVMTNGTAWSGKSMTQLSCGSYHCIILASDGAVFSWGFAANGLQGDGQIGGEKLIPSQIDNSHWGGEIIHQVSAGVLHSLAVSRAGVVFGWGAGGNIGDGGTDHRLTPTRLTTIPKSISFVAASTASFALATDGTVYRWGTRGDYLLHPTDTSHHILLPTEFIGPWAGKTISKMVITSENGFIITSDGSLYSWGKREFGSLGRSDLDQSPKIVQSWYAREVLDVSGGRKVFALVRTYCADVASNDPSVCLGRGNCTRWNDCTCNSYYTGSNCQTPKCYGIPANNQFLVCSSSNGICTDVNTCSCFDGYYGEQCQYINSTGASQNDKDFRVFAWGSGESGQTGSAPLISGDYLATVPWEIDSKLWKHATSIVQLASAEAHTLALSKEGSVYAWGINYDGRIGQDFSQGIRVRPVLIDDSRWDGQKIVVVAAGRMHSLAVGSNGDLFVWGGNDEGQHGDGTDSPKHIPTKLDRANWNGKNITWVAAGGYFSLALADDGTIYGWGLNDMGQLADPSLSSSLTPVLIPSSSFGVETVVNVYAGYWMSIALTSTHAVYVWGGLLSSSNPQPIPTRIDDSHWNGKTITSVSCGEYHIIALASDGTVFAWGDGSQGQVGSFDNKDSPYELPASYWQEKTIVKVSAGSWHSLALASDGTLFGWGNNEFLQLSNDFQSRDVPMIIEGMAGKDIAVLGTGGLVTMVVVETWCYGLRATDPMVCSGNGVCNSTNSCLCNETRTDTAYGYWRNYYEGNTCTTLASAGYITALTGTVVHLNDSVYHITSDLIIAQNQTLVISPGTTLRMHPNTKIIVEGNLVAQGNTSNWITIDSDGSSGKWNGIQVQASSQNSIFKYVAFRNGGYNAKSVLQVRSAATVIDEVSFENSDSFGIFICELMWSPGSVHGGEHHNSLFVTYSNC